MNKGYLSEYFVSVGTKVLTRVDATTKSNQHEIGDNNHGELLKQILGNTPRKKKLGNRLEAVYVWLHGEQETITDYGYLSFYDTREKKKHRNPEWRLYYQSNDVTKYMDEGDRLFLAKRPDESILFLVVPEESVLLADVFWLFGLSPDASEEFVPEHIDESSDRYLDFISRFILDELGIEYEDPDSNTLDSIIDKFVIAKYGLKFPKTSEFSELARLTLPESDPLGEPDATLMAWLNHEEALFRRLEKEIVGRRIQDGFINEGQIDVDGFIKYSLSVQNRRKSRMGHSLENQLKALFEANYLKFDTQVITENNKKPDFIFPGANEYGDPFFSVELLTMLAAKSTCKDRWPQILPEAQRLDKKHLVTLEPGISEKQTETMITENVQLIVPLRLQDSYLPNQRKWLFTISDFITTVREKEKRITL